MFAELTPVRKLMFLNAIAGPKAVEYTASGNPVVFETNIAKPLRRLALSLLPRQSGTGDPSPSNIRPLLPWGEVGTWTGGANTWDEQWEVGTISIETGENVVANDRIRAKNYNPCVPNKAYYIVDPTHGKNIRLFYYDKDKTFVGDSSWKDGEITTPSNAYFFRFIVASSYGTAYKNDIAINYPSSVTTYSPSAITPHPVDLSSITPAVYGCELDLTTGEGSIRPIEIESIKWGDGRSAQVIGNVERRGFIFAKKAKTVDELNADATARFCSIAPWKYNYSSDDVHFYGGEWSFYVFLPVGTSDDFEFQICAERNVAPTPFTLTPQQISALVGVNTVWSDADNIDLTYLKKG